MKGSSFTLFVRPSGPARHVEAPTGHPLTGNVLSKLCAVPSIPQVCRETETGQHLGIH